MAKEDQVEELSENLATAEARIETLESEVSDLKDSVDKLVELARGTHPERAEEHFGPAPVESEED